MARYQTDDDGSEIVRQDEDGNGQFYRMVMGDDNWEKEYFNPNPQPAPQPTVNPYAGGIASLVQPFTQPTADVMPNNSVSTPIDQGIQAPPGVLPTADEPRVEPLPSAPIITEQPKPVDYSSGIMTPGQWGGPDAGLSNSAGGKGQATLKLLPDSEDKPSVEDVQKADFLGLAKNKIFSEQDDDGHTRLYTIGTDENAQGKNYSSSAIKNAVNEAYQNWNTNLDSASKVYSAGKADWDYKDVNNGLGSRGAYDINNLWGGSKVPPRITDWAHMDNTQKEATFFAGQTRDELWNVYDDLRKKGITPALNPDQVALKEYQTRVGDNAGEYGYGIGANTLVIGELLKQSFLNQPEVAKALGKGYQTSPEKLPEIEAWGQKHQSENNIVYEQIKEAARTAAGKQGLIDWLPDIFMSAATAGFMAPGMGELSTALGGGIAGGAGAGAIAGGARGVMTGSKNLLEDIVTGGVAGSIGGAFAPGGEGALAAKSLSDSLGVSVSTATNILKSLGSSGLAAVTGRDPLTALIASGASNFASSAAGDFLKGTSTDIDSQPGGFYGDQPTSPTDSFKETLANSPILTKAFNSGAGAIASAVATGKDPLAAVERVLVGSGLEAAGLLPDAVKALAPVIVAAVTGGNVDKAAANLAMSGFSGAMKNLKGDDSEEDKTVPVTFGSPDLDKQFNAIDDRADISDLYKYGVGSEETPVDDRVDISKLSDLGVGSEEQPAPIDILNPPVETTQPPASTETPPEQPKTGDMVGGSIIAGQDELGGTVYYDFKNDRYHNEEGSTVSPPEEMSSDTVTQEEIDAINDGTYSTYKGPEITRSDDDALTEEQEWAAKNGVLNPDGTIDWAAYDAESGVGTGGSGSEQTEEEVREQMGKDNFELAYPDGYPSEPGEDWEDPSNCPEGYLWDGNACVKIDDTTTDSGGGRTGGGGAGGGGGKTGGGAKGTKQPSVPVKRSIPTKGVTTPKSPAQVAQAMTALSQFMAGVNLSPAQIKYYVDMASKGILPEQAKEQIASVEESQKEKATENDSEGDFAYGGFTGYDDEFTIEDLLNMLRS